MDNFVPPFQSSLQLFNWGNFDFFWFFVSFYMLVKSAIPFTINFWVGKVFLTHLALIVSDGIVFLSGNFYMHPPAFLYSVHPIWQIVNNFFTNFFWSCSGQLLWQLFHNDCTKLKVRVAESDNFRLQTPNHLRSFIAIRNCRSFELQDFLVWVYSD